MPRGKWQRAASGGADVVTHTSLTSDLGPGFDALLAGRSVVIIPTLTMMQGVVHAIGGRFAMRMLAPFVPAIRLNYRHAKSTVATFHRAGVVILAGTESGQPPLSPTGSGGPRIVRPERVSAHSVAQRDGGLHAVAGQEQRACELPGPVRAA